MKIDQSNNILGLQKLNWKEKVMHGHLLRHTEEVAGKCQWLLPMEGSLKRETGIVIMVAQEQALRVNLVKGKYIRLIKYRICGKTDEMDTKELKRTYDSVGKRYIGRYVRNYGFDTKTKRYEY